ncbi:MAG TPA: ABC transporter permease [Gemmatimonadaceae bacterium]|nr:ABC transporter permease [Gemmatimonadaceae bacterium]
MSLARLRLVLALDLRHNLRRPLFWILLVLLFLMAWGMSAGNVRIGTGDSSVGGRKAWLTSEFAQTQLLAAIVFIIYAFFIAVGAGMSVIADAEAKVGEVLHATPLRPREYVWGKFLAVLATFGLVLAVHVALNVMFNHAVPNAGMAEARGPFHLVNYVRPALLFALPAIVFFAGTSFYVGEATRKPILVFVLPVAIVLFAGFFLWSWTPSWLDPKVNRLLMLIDPAGIRWLSETWLKVDRGVEFYNTTRVRLDAGFALSRLAFLGIGLGAAAMSARHFERTLRSSGRVRVRRGAARDGGRGMGDELPRDVPSGVSSPVPHPASLSSLGMTSRAPSFFGGAWTVARAELRELRFQPGLYLFVPLILLQTLGNVFNALGPFDTPLLFTPGTLATSVMPYMTSLVLLLLLFYATESVARERTTGFATIHSSLPVRTGSLLAGKIVALGAVAAVVMLTTLVACWIAILVQGKVPFDIRPFAIVWGLLLAPTFLVWTAFVLMTFTLTGNRYTTYGVGIAVLIYTFYRWADDKMNWVGNWPLWGAVRWSDLSVLEFDREVILYNRLFVLSLAALFLAAAARAFPRRERDATGLLMRLRGLRFLRLPLVALPLVALPLILGVMTWRQVERGAGGGEGRRKARNYWKQNLASWREAPLPSIADVDLDLTLEPAARTWSVRGSYLLRNHHPDSLARVPVTVNPIQVDSVRWTLGGAPCAPDTLSGLYVFQTNLAPGDTVRIGFSYRGRQRGSSENGGGAGEFLLPSAVVMTSFGPRWFPSLGFDEELGVERDENDYEPRRYPKGFEAGLTEPAFGSATPFTVRMRVTAPAGYAVNGVGTLVSDSTANGTRVTVWASDRPVKFFNVVAGKWNVKKGQGTALYYHPAHAFNVAEMSEALDAARRHYSEWFAPYPWRELKVSEFPALASYAQGFPTNISFSEGIGFLTRSEPRTNLAFMVTAHESAHQWWGNKLTPGRGPGGNILSEGMAHFSTILLLEQTKGERNATEFRKRIESSYGDDRRADAERALVDVDGTKAGDNTVTYDKGGWVAWMLLRQMGRERALAGLRAFIATYRDSSDHPVLYDFVPFMRRYADDTLGFDAFARQWYYAVVVPEYRVTGARARKESGTWTTTATVTNVGTGRFPVQVAAVRGERWPQDTTKKAAVPYGIERVSVTLGPKDSTTVTIRSPWKPDRVVVDPDVTLLMLRRTAALGKID